MSEQSERKERRKMKNDNKKSKNVMKTIKIITIILLIVSPPFPITSLIFSTLILVSTEDNSVAIFSCISIDGS